MPPVPPVIDRYLRSNPWASALEDRLPAPRPGLKLCVVIPSLAESQNLPAVLDSLACGSRRLDECEVVVLVNQGENAPAEITRDNHATMELRAVYAASPVSVHFVDRFSRGRSLAAKQAGVGLARRLGLDLGLDRLVRAGQVERSCLACLDADSPVGPGYLDTLLEAFDREDQPPAAVCAYAHPMPAEAALRLPMVAYELWLRYLVAGFNAAGSVFAFSAIGSCTVVSAGAYAQVRGLEPRKAAEDFHFLRKLAKLNGLQLLPQIPGAMVYPAARLSDRVPFGTGRAMQRSAAEGRSVYLHVEPPEVFLEVAEFFRRAPEAFSRPAAWHGLPRRLDDFLGREGAWPVFEKFRALYPGSQQFTLAVQHWFDSLKIVRYANAVTRQQGRIWAFQAWKALLQALGQWAAAADLPLPVDGCQDLALLGAWLQAVRELQSAALSRPGMEYNAQHRTRRSEDHV